MNNGADLLAAEPSVMSVVFQMGFSLAMVLGLVLLVVWFLKNRSRSLGVRPNGLQLLSQLSLGGRKRLCLVKVAEKILVLGVSDAHISQLLVLNSADLPQDFLAHCSPMKSFGDVFADKLKKVWSEHEN